MKKFLTSLLVLALVASLAAGFSSADGETHEPYEIVWSIGNIGATEDYDLVWPVVNEKLQEHYPWLTVKGEFTFWNDFPQRFLLMQTSGEKLDITQTYVLNFTELATNGSALPLNDLLAEYAPDTLAEVPDFMWDFVTMGDTIYGVPHYQMMIQHIYSFWTIREIREKYGLDLDALASSMQDATYMTEEFYDLVEDYLTRLKEGGDLYLGWDPRSEWIFFKEYIYTYTGTKYLCTTRQDQTKVVCRFYDRMFTDYIARMRDWYVKGLITPDILSLTTVPSEWYNGGFIAGFGTQSTAKHLMINENQSDKRLVKDQVLSHKEFLMQPYADAGNTVVMWNSERPEEAVRFIDLLNTDKGADLYNTLVWGLEGTHYDVESVQEDGTVYIRTRDYDGSQGVQGSPWSLATWSIGNQSNAYNNQGMQMNWEGMNYRQYMFEYLNPNAIIVATHGFLFDPVPVETQIAQVKTVIDEYQKPLMCGALENYEEVYAEFIQKLEAAGILEVQAEVQAQIDAFIAAKA